MRQLLNSRIFFLVPLLAAIAFTACKREEAADPLSPAYQIAQSDKLVIPAAIDLPVPPSGKNQRVATFFATGVQKYKSQQCPTCEPGTYEWVLVAPQADLFDIKNRRIGTHSAGPTWQLNGSATDSIYAQQFTPSRSAPSPDGNSIPWLLLKPKDGKTPTGIFAGVAYIQRIATVGGKAPSYYPTEAGLTAEVNYTAVYRFSKIVQ